MVQIDKAIAAAAGGQKGAPAAGLRNPFAALKSRYSQYELKPTTELGDREQVKVAPVLFTAQKGCGKTVAGLPGFLKDPQFGGEKKATAIVVSFDRVTGSSMRMRFGPQWFKEHPNVTLYEPVLAQTHGDKVTWPGYKPTIPETAEIVNAFAMSVLEEVARNPVDVVLIDHIQAYVEDIAHDIARYRAGGKEQLQYQEWRPRQDAINTILDAAIDASKKWVVMTGYPPELTYVHDTIDKGDGKTGITNIRREVKPQKYMEKIWKNFECILLGTSSRLEQIMKANDTGAAQKIAKQEWFMEVLDSRVEPFRTGDVLNVTNKDVGVFFENAKALQEAKL